VLTCKVICWSSREIRDVTSLPIGRMLVRQRLPQMGATPNRGRTACGPKLWEDSSDEFLGIYLFSIPSNASHAKLGIIRCTAFRGVVCDPFR
jgi:hypothetical protein